jgi:hypothetical protein
LILALATTPRYDIFTTMSNPAYHHRYMNGMPVVPNLIPPQHAESKRDRKRRETVNKIELLHQESWNNRDE